MSAPFSSSAVAPPVRTAAASRTTGLWLPRRHAGRLIAIGAVLLVGSWWMAWFGPTPWSWYTFFPLWFGYILTVDGVVLRRTGTSALSRDPARFARLFILSAPFWWAFEAANERLGNWEYRVPLDYPPFVYLLLATLSFSTVVPAVFETAELYRSIRPFRPERRWIVFRPGPPVLAAIAAVGAAMVVLAVTFPERAFPLIWVGAYLLLEPANLALGGGDRTIAGQVARGRWDTVLVLFAAGLTCGILWEGWNFWSTPKWEYNIPYFAEPRLFEMPLLGYGAYLPFALELFAAYQFVVLLVFRRPDSGLVFDRPAGPVEPLRTSADR